MQVEYLVRISLPDDGWDVNMLEEACWKAGYENQLVGSSFSLHKFGRAHPVQVGQLFHHITLRIAWLDRT